MQQLDQLGIVSDKEYLDNVIDIAEASEILGIAKGYLRTLILRGEFEAWEYKKLGKNIILLKKSVIARKGKFKKYNKNCSDNN